ncbi:MAG: hypothetical protein Q9160_006116 [Pyrenula sp. 1 TL-2023]
MSLTFADKRWVKRASGGWLDSVNNMITSESIPGCQDNTNTLGITYKGLAPEPALGKDGKPSPLAGQPANRAVFTICDYAFENPVKLKAPRKLNDVPPNSDLTTTDVGYFQYLLSMTILHEVRFS